MSPSLQRAALLGAAVVREVEKVFLGKEGVVTHAVTALLARGHVLLEDVPGAGKTVLARALARATGGDFRRIQFTSDLLPSDITGVSTWSPRNESFSFHPGPIFAHVVLADEVNRAGPRTQSALLEAMSERQVSIDRETRPLPDPFLVIATQNPHEHHGTYPLPESQMDRFLVRLTIGYPPREAERRIIEVNGYSDKVEELVVPVTTPEAILEAQRHVGEVTIPAPVMDYVMELVERTRRHEGLELGISTRGAVSLMSACRARALLEGRDFVLADDVKTMLLPTCAHRVVPRGRGVQGSLAREEASAVLADILARTPVPGD